jgi:VanZ family protein
MPRLLKKIQLLIKAYLPLILWALLIFFLSSRQVLPGFEVSLFDFLLKKMAHMFVFAVFYILSLRAVKMSFSSKRTYLQLFLPIILVILYALTDELHQSFVPNRYATLRDVGYDMLGVLLVFLKKYKYL